MSKISFEEVLKDCKNKPNFAISPGCKTEIQGFFTICRVDRKTVPYGYYAYDIRGGKYGFGTIEESVLVDHAGTFITKQQIPMTKKGYRCLSGRGGYSYIC